jgi:hypothetical protein
MAVFFTWSAVLGKILPLYNLRKRHIIIVDKCCLCKRDGESVDHIFLHCDVASALWNNFFFRFGISWVMPVGGRLEDQGALQHGRWCLSAFCGVFGEKETLGVLRT